MGAKIAGIATGLAMILYIRNSEDCNMQLAMQCSTSLAYSALASRQAKL